MNTIYQKLPSNVVVTSILLALFADTKMINLIVLAARPSLAGVFMTAMYAIVVVGLFYMGIIRQSHSIRQLSPSHIFVCGLCVFWYISTLLLIGQPSVSLTFFGIFTVASFLIPGLITIDVRTFLLALLLLPSVGILYVDQIIFNAVAEEGTLSMGKCYSMLVPVLANLVYLRFYFPTEKKLVKFMILPFTAINLFYLIQMSMFGSRGPVFCALLLVASFFLFSENQDNSIRLKRGRTILVMVVALIVFEYFVEILQLLNNYLSGFGISLNAIDKFLLMNERGDMSNGRDSISSIVWDGIWNSPIIGHGVSQFENNTGIVYPHNFIKQLLYDGGLFLTLGVFIPIIQAFRTKIRTIQKDELACLLLLFFASVPGALFSGDLWESGELWLLGGYLLSNQRFIAVNN